MIAIAIVIGLTESLIVRLRFRALPLLSFAALLISLVCLVVVHSNQGSAP